MDEPVVLLKLELCIIVPAVLDVERVDGRTVRIVVPLLIDDVENETCCDCCCDCCPPTPLANAARTAALVLDAELVSKNELFIEPIPFVDKRCGWIVIDVDELFEKCDGGGDGEYWPSFCK